MLSGQRYFAGDAGSMIHRLSPTRIPGGASAWTLGLGLALLLPGVWAQVPDAPRSGIAEAEREPPAPTPGDPAVAAALEQIADLGKRGQFTEALERVATTLETCRMKDDAAGEALAHARRAELLEKARRKPEAVDAWTASARAWERAGYVPGSIEGWWRAALAGPINTPHLQTALIRAADLATADRRRPLASAAACRKGARTLEAEKRPLSAKRLYAAALEIYAREAPDSQELVWALIDLGDLLRERDELEPAANHLRRALFLAERREAGSRLAAEVLNLLAVVYARQGKLSDAEQLRVREVAVWRKLEPDSSKLGHALLNYGLVFVRRGDDLRAERILLEARAMLEKRAPRSLGYASAVEALGAVAVRRGQWKTGSQLYQEAYDIRMAVDPESETLAVSLVNLAGVRIQQGDLSAADRYLARALEIRVKRLAESLEVAHIRTVQAAVARMRGDVPAARQALEMARRIYERRSRNSPPYAFTLIELGYMSYQEGNLQAAWKQMADGVTILEKEAGRSTQLAIGLARLAKVVIDRGDFGVARTYLTRALSIYEQQKLNSLSTIQILTQLGRVAACEGLPEEARGYLERALKILQQTESYPEAHARVLAGLAELSLAAGRPAEASPLIADALARVRNPRISQAALAELRHLEAECREAEKRPAEAEAAYRQALDIWKQRAPRSPGRPQTLYRLARLLHATPARRAEAVRLATEAWDLLQQQSAGIAGDESLQALVRLRAPVAAGVAALLVDAGESVKPLQILEENRAQGLRHLLDEQPVRPAGVSDAAWQTLSGAKVTREQAEERVISRANTLTQARHDLERLRAGTGPAAEIETLKQQVGELEEALAEAERGLTEARDRVQRLWTQLRAPEASAVPRADFPLGLAHARQAARDGTALLYFSAGEDRTLLFFFPPGAGSPLQVHSLPIKLPVLAAEVGGLVGAMREAQAQAVSRSRTLSERLLPPGVRAGLSRARRVVVIPDGPLWELPFGVLVLPEAKSAAPTKTAKAAAPSPALPRFLGLERSISIESSLSLFAERERSAPSFSGRASFKVLAMGDPALPSAGPGAALASASPARSMLPGALSELGPLPGTRADAQAVAQLYGVQPLLGESASEAAVRAALPDADVVHFATHGYLHPFWSRASGLVLSRPVEAAADLRPEEDGLLQSWEIYDGLRLRADLVVLAACETGVGAISRGEGVNSLSRAFRAAGARSVVASLWKVRDDSTRQLMVAFHQHIRRGLAKDEALQHAMKDLAARPGMRHPYHWGAFLLIGDRANHLVAPPPATAKPRSPAPASSRPPAPKPRVR